MEDYNVRELYEKTEKLDKKLTDIQNEFNVYKENIRKREYLVRTVFRGEIKRQQLLDELKRYSKGLYTFYELTDQIDYYDFTNIDSVYNKVMELSEMQRVLNQYGEN